MKYIGEVNMKRNFFSLLKKPFNSKGGISFPGDILTLYVYNHFSQEEKNILDKLERGENLENSEYQHLIESHFMKPGERNQSIKKEGIEASLEMFGISIIDGKYEIIPERLPQIRREVYDKILTEGLKPLYQPILNNMFPSNEISLGIWPSHAEEDLQSLDSTLRIALQFTLFEYIHGENVDDYSDFGMFFTNEFNKRANLVKSIWINRKNESTIKYIPIYENFRNYKKQDAVYTMDIIKKFFNSNDILLNEKSEIENRLISQGKRQKYRTLTTVA